MSFVPPDIGDDVDSRIPDTPDRTVHETTRNFKRDMDLAGTGDNDAIFLREFFVFGSCFRKIHIPAEAKIIIGIGPEITRLHCNSAKMCEFLVSFCLAVGKSDVHMVTS